jgi:hypothetical protein
MPNFTHNIVKNIFSWILIESPEENTRNPYEVTEVNSVICFWDTVVQYILLYLCKLCK